MSSCTSLFVVSDDGHFVLSSFIYTMINFLIRSEPIESQETV
jgi:hypothetical protein